MTYTLHSCGIDIDFNLVERMIFQNGAACVFYENDTYLLIIEDEADVENLMELWEE